MNTRVVLLVEDNPTDATLIAQAVQDGTVPARVVHVSDCERALEFLRSRPEKMPSLIMLALDSPGSSAFNFLETIKADETLKAIPVIGLARSNEPSDVSEGFAHAIAGYIVKSGEPTRLREEIATIRAYWTLSRLPRTA
jgi:CheY-like chemotaxis protein